VFAPLHATLFAKHRLTVVSQQPPFAGHVLPAQHWMFVLPHAVHEPPEHTVLAAPHAAFVSTHLPVVLSQQPPFPGQVFPRQHTAPEAPHVWQVPPEQS
jgi:hypothetical protein